METKSRTGWMGPRENMSLGWKASYKHGRPPAYNSWHGMFSRCENPRDKRYADYGGRGIKICGRWRDFMNFLADMGQRPAGTSLDRYPDKNGNYEPGNCRWATPGEQQNNMRSNQFVTCEGEQVTIAEACRRLGIVRSTLVMRLRRGWSEERALQR